MVVTLVNPWKKIPKPISVPIAVNSLQSIEKKEEALILPTSVLGIMHPILANKDENTVSDTEKPRLEGFTNLKRSKEKML